MAAWKRGLGADRLRQGIGHRAVRKGADETPLAIHLEIARRPDGWRADITGENRVLGRDLAQHFGEILGMDRLAPRRSDGERIEILARTPVVPQRRAPTAIGYSLARTKVGRVRCH